MLRGLTETGECGIHAFRRVISWLWVCAFALQGVLAHHHLHDAHGIADATTGVSVGLDSDDQKDPTDRSGHRNDANCPGCVVSATSLFVLSEAPQQVARSAPISGRVHHLVLERKPEHRSFTRSSRGPPALLSA